MLRLFVVGLFDVGEDVFFDLGGDGLDFGFDIDGGVGFEEI